jgi:hypothetical protein
VNTHTNVQHCGACNQPCPSYPNAVMGCSNGECRIASCVGAWRDCDGVLTNGCEMNTDTSAEHCGRCDRSCGSGVCAAGSCCPSCGDAACCSPKACTWNPVLEDFQCK